MTVNQVSEFLNISRGKIYLMAQKGEFPCFKVGELWRFDEQKVKEWLKDKETPENCWEIPEIAQSVEQLIRNQYVAGSYPAFLKQFLANYLGYFLEVNCKIISVFRLLSEWL